jgi:hypothetical protein
VTRAITNQSENDRASIYFVAFDIASSKFDSVRDAGGSVLSASDETELRGTLDYLLTGKILAEQRPSDEDFTSRIHAPIRSIVPPVFWIHLQWRIPRSSRTSRDCLKFLSSFLGRLALRGGSLPAYELRDGAL